MARYGEVRPVNVFADFMAGKQTRQDEQARQQDFDDRQLANSLQTARLERQRNVNALTQNPNATPEDYIRGGDPATGNALLGYQQQQQMDKRQALEQVSELSVRTLQIPPDQRKAFLASPEIAQVYGPAFQAIGADHNKGLLELQQLPDDELESRLSRVAQFRAKEKPIEVSAGASLVTPKAGGGYEAAFTAPTAPPAPAKRTVEWQDVGNQKIPVYSDTGQRVPNLEPLPKGATPGSVTATDQRNFTRADKLRDEYNSASKDFVAIGDTYTRMREAARDPSAAGDLSLIFQYMKMLDPGSVVREQEFANAQNAAGVPDRIRNAYNNARNGQRLNPNQRQDFLNNAQKLYTGQRSRHEKTVKGRYSELAKRYSLNPDDVVGDFDVIDRQAAGGEAGAPTATGPNGQKLILQNGQWVPAGG
jgi:hypothetical protein